jgi:hypothetical protein
VAYLIGRRAHFAQFTACFAVFRRVLRSASRLGSDQAKYLNVQMVLVRAHQAEAAGLVRLPDEASCSCLPPQATSAPECLPAQQNVGSASRAPLRHVMARYGVNSGSRERLGTIEPDPRSPRPLAATQALLGVCQELRERDRQSASRYARLSDGPAALRRRSAGRTPASASCGTRWAGPTLRHTLVSAHSSGTRTAPSLTLRLPP